MPIPVQHLPDNVANNKDTEEQYALLKEIARRSRENRSPLVINGVEVELVLPSERGGDNEKTT